jgi:hypothetical protein
MRHLTHDPPFCPHPPVALSAKCSILLRACVSFRGFTKTSPYLLEISYLVCFFHVHPDHAWLVEIAIMILVCPSMTARCFWCCTSAVRLGYGSAAKTKTTSSLHEACLAYSTVVHLFFFCLLGVLLTGDPMCLVSPRNGDPFPQRKKVKLRFFLVRFLPIASKFCLTSLCLPVAHTLFEFLSWAPYLKKNANTPPGIVQYSIWAASKSTKCH